MKRYTFLLSIIAVMLIAFTACYEVEGTSTSDNEPEYVHGAIAHHDAGVIQDEAIQTVMQTISWQDAYSEKLLSYAQHPIETTDSENAEWRFMLHDINQDGIPELFLVIVYEDGRVDHRAVYTLVDGDVVQIKAAISSSFPLPGGMIVPPNGASGVIWVQITGHVVHYNKLELNSGMLSPVVNADVVAIADSFRINAHPVTESEFESVFGSRDEKEWLALHEITEANTRDIIFGWLPTTD